MAVTEGPRLKVGMLKSVLADIRQMEASQRAAIMARIDQTIIDEVDDATRTEWLPASYVIAMDAALMSELGPTGFHDYWRAFGARPIQIPMIRPLAAAVVRLFSGPAGILKMIPKAYQLTARDFGSLNSHLHEDERGIDLVYTHMPPLKDLRLFGLACEGAYHTAFDLLKIPGEVHMDRERTSGPTIWLTARW